MVRTEVPPVTRGWSGRHSVELYVRTYSTMLQSSGWIRLDSLVHAHVGMEPSLHGLAASSQVDMGAFLYAVRRLPPQAARARKIALGQSPNRFRSVLGVEVEEWERARAPARRRPWYYDGADTLAAFLASSSDIDDLVPALVAYQIEWNKLHHALRDSDLTPDQAYKAAGVGEDDWERLREAWAPHFEETLAQVAAAECHFQLRRVGGSHVGFARNCARWWQPIQATIAELGLSEAPVYFVSSNEHSLVNVLSGVARHYEPQVIEHTRRTDPGLIEELRRVERGETPASRHNWLYFAARSLFDQHPETERLRAERRALEAQVGIRHLPPRSGGMDSAAQVIKLSSLDPTQLDPRVGRVDPAALARSQAYVINIDYPLGVAAYHALRQVAESVPAVEGIYVMGKAATLNADVGDVMIPNAVYNEHSSNTYWLDNCFTAATVQPHLVFGSALDNQRAVTVRGTFLQNRDYLDFYYQGHFTVVEMEAGPYLDACFEVLEPRRHPVNESVSMTHLGLDLGIIHYASDTPYTQARTLGARGLSYQGMDSTYASAVAVTRRILDREGALAEDAPGD